MARNNDVLKRYGEYSVKVAELIKEGGRLNSDDEMTVENSVLIVQLAMAMSKYNRIRAEGSARTE